MSRMSRILDFKAPKNEIFTPHQWPPPPPLPPPSSSLQISPAILLTILILSAIFFVSALIHLLIRFFTKSPSSSPSPNAAESSGAIQTQLHEMFQLHDSGLDQTAIDALPIFYYKDIIAGGGLKEPSDCAVCLCEFSDEDKLRLLPNCRHAFHVQCIDTWLLSHSSCPLCRGTLVGSVVEKLDIVDEEESERVFSVRLGKFRSFNVGEKLSALEVRDEEGSGRYLDSRRRCYSMGSYQYIVGDLDLRVTLSWRARQEEHHSISRVVSAEEEGLRDSFSISKIWLWPKHSSSRFCSMQLPRNNVTTVQNINAGLH